MPARRSATAAPLSARSLALSTLVHALVVGAVLTNPVLLGAGREPARASAVVVFERTPAAATGLRGEGTLLARLELPDREELLDQAELVEADRELDPPDEPLLEDPPLRLPEIGAGVAMHPWPRHHPRSQTQPGSTSEAQAAPAEETPSPAEQDAARGEPPPLLDAPPPDYPLRARRRGWEGTVTCVLIVEPDGSVRDVRVRVSSGHAVLDAAAVDALRAWRFVPASAEEGARTFVHAVSFRLEDGAPAAPPR